MSIATQTVILFSLSDQPPPPVVDRWLNGLGLNIVRARTTDDVMAISLRGRPRVAAFDARSHEAEAYGACRRLKADSYTGVVPCVIVACDDEAAFARAFEAGADEVIRESVPDREVRIRLDALLRRSDRDLVVHPSTRLLGAVEIEAEVTRRLHSASIWNSIMLKSCLRQRNRGRG